MVVVSRSREWANQSSIRLVDGFRGAGGTLKSSSGYFSIDKSAMSHIGLGGARWLVGEENRLLIGMWSKPVEGMEVECKETKCGNKMGKQKRHCKGEVDQTGSILTCQREQSVDSGAIIESLCHVCSAVEVRDSGEFRSARDNP